MLQTGRSDPHLHSQDVFFRPPNWDSGSLHSLPQGRRQWQIKLLTHLFRGVGARSTASWLKWWVRDSEGSCIIGAQCCGVMFAKQGPAMKRAEIKSSVLNSASVITCKKKKKSITPASKCTTLYWCPFGLPCCWRISCALQMEGSFRALHFILSNSDYKAPHLRALLCYYKQELFLTGN